MCYTLENRLLHGQDSVFNVTKKLRTKQTTVFRPIANLRFLYKTFVAVLLGGSDQIVDAQHPEGQHDFRAGRRLEEPFLSAQQPDSECGISVWNCRRHYGLPSLSKEFLNIWCGSCDGRATDKVVKLLVTSVRVTNSPSQAVRDKAAFSVHGYFFLSGNLFCENGGMLLGRLASIWWMGALISLIYASRVAF